MKSQIRIFQKLRLIGSKVQPLTVRSSVGSSPVSDLFIWKKNRDWETYFRLVNQERIVSGPNLSSKPRFAIFIYFSNDGTEIKRVTHAIPEKHSALISITEEIADYPGTFGTFCVIHSCCPKDLTDINCQLAERGYVGYSFRGSRLLSYAHGNLDAVAMRKDGTIEMLGGSSIMKREYRLQYSIDPTEENLLAFVNPFKKDVKLNISLLSNSNKITPEKEFKFRLPPRGSKELSLQFDCFDCEYSIRVRSRLCLARPVLFTHRGENFNVFHG